MIDPNDFIAERGGDPEKIRESQRRRHSPVEWVDEIIEMFHDHKKSQYSRKYLTSASEQSRSQWEETLASQTAD
jgi:seryl-tRNA synthetase